MILALKLALGAAESEFNVESKLIFVAAVVYKKCTY